MIYNIFYNSNREIGWTTDSECPDYIVQDQLTQGLKHLTVDQSDLPIAENYYVNEAEDGSPSVVAICISTFVVSNSFACPSKNPALSSKFPSILSISSLFFVKESFLICWF